MEGGCCENCGAELEGPYCHRCGQQDLDLDRPFFGLAREWLGSLFAFDARLWWTLKPLMARPGALTEEYLAGRRVCYVPPFRLYFFASLGMFLALAWSGYSIVHRSPTDDAVAVTVETTEGDETGWADRRVARLMEQPDEVVNALYRERLAQTLILLTFGFAVFTRALFPRPHRRLFDHLVFAMHVHAAAFVAIVAVRAAGALADPLTADYATRVLGLAFMAFLAVYLFRALRRFHRLGRLSTLWRFAVLAATYLVALVVTLMGTMILAGAFA